MTTRRQFLGPASPKTERGPLTALVAFQQEVVFGYEVTLAKAPLQPHDRATLERFRAQAEAAAGALRTALERENGNPPPAPDPATAPPAKDPTRDGYLRDVIVVEEDSVARYYLALRQLLDEHHLAGSAAFMAQAGRRLVVLRRWIGQPLLPRAFETGSA